jgi:hypothetical protein
MRAASMVMKLMGTENEGFTMEHIGIIMQVWIIAAKVTNRVSRTT